MASRTPSFIVVGLVIIMFLLGSFYMSCSSKNNELRQSLEQFEDRIRLLTIRNSDSEKNIENINSRKRELEEEKLNIQKQMEKKDSEINDLNTKLNEKLSELQSLKSDKTVLDQQLNEFKSMKDTLASKNSIIDQLTQQLAEQKQAVNDEIARLKHEQEVYKDRTRSQNNQLPSNGDQQNNQVPSNNDQQNNQVPPSDNELRNKFPIPPQRYRPFPSNTQTRRSIASLIQNPMNQLNNLTKEIKPEIVAAAVDLKDKVLNVLGVNTSSTTTNQSNDQQEVGQNVPPPPLANNAQRQQQPGHIESAQAAPRSADQPNENNQQADNLPNQQRLQRSVNDSLPNNEKDDEDQVHNEKDDEDRLHNEKDDEEQPDKENIQENIPAPVHFNKQDNVNHRIDDNDAPPSPIVKKNRYRKGLRERFQQNQDNVPRERKLDNGGEIEDENNNNNNNEEDRGVRRRIL